MFSFESGELDPKERRFEMPLDAAFVDEFPFSERLTLANMVLNFF